VQTNIEQIERTIQAWIEAKTNISGSQCTRRNYSDNIRWFREWLQERGLDLNSEDTCALADELERWSRRDKHQPQTYNNRVGVVSSFYVFARRRRLLSVNNPAELVERVSTQMYATSRALDFEELRQKLAVIDRSTLQGKRDFSLLMLALQTGRRREEIAQLRMGDIEITGQRITITWRRCKGGKIMLDTLPSAIHAPLIDYLTAIYGSSFADLSPESPVWVRVRSRYKDIEPITASAISHICEHRLGTSNIHRLRHTFAKAMEKVGAPLSDIQARLGHNSLATTGIYLAALSRDENPNGDALATFFGFDTLNYDNPVPPPTRYCEECKQPFTFIQREERRRLYCSQKCSRAAQRRKMEERAAEQSDPLLRRRRPASTRWSNSPSTGSSVEQLSLWAS
jgi:site-specific recombinase XerD